MISIPLAPMGALAPLSAQGRHSIQPHINTSGMNMTSRTAASYACRLIKHSLAGVWSELNSYHNNLLVHVSEKITGLADSMGNSLTFPTSQSHA